MCSDLFNTGKGVSDKMFRERHPKVSPADLALAINELSMKGLVGLFKSGSSIIYKAVSLDEVEL